MLISSLRYASQSQGLSALPVTSPSSKSLHWKTHNNITATIRMPQGIQSTILVRCWILLRNLVFFTCCWHFAEKNGLSKGLEEKARFTHCSEGSAGADQTGCSGDLASVSCCYRSQIQRLGLFTPTHMISLPENAREHLTWSHSHPRVLDLQGLSRFLSFWKGIGRDRTRETLGYVPSSVAPRGGQKECARGLYSVDPRPWTDSYGSNSPRKHTVMTGLM